jgi:hypothetical protein
MRVSDVEGKVSAWPYERGRFGAQVAAAAAAGGSQDGCCDIVMDAVLGRGLHSTTSQLNLNRVCHNNTPCALPNTPDTP